jgi:hypothetical protein
MSENKNDLMLLCWNDIMLPARTHYRNRVLCRVSKTLGKGYFTLGKAFAECNTRQIFHRQMVLCRVLFFGHSAKTLPSVKKHSANFRIEKIKKKQQNIFLNSRNNSPTLPYYLTHYPIIFHYYFESNLHVL